MKQPTILFENCANSVASCLAAERGGAGRIELCVALPEGGTTPPYGMVSLALEQVAIPIYPIVRPRAGDFLYSELELEEMVRDITQFRALGVAGISTGVLTAEGRLDKVANRRLIEAAGGLPVTLHRAFDMTEDLLQALEDAIEIGFARILTSGGAPNVVEGIPMLARLVQAAGDRIIIMPGSGVRVDNAAEIIRRTGAKEIHGTLQSTIPSEMKYRKPAISMGGTVHIDEYARPVTDPIKIQKLLSSFKQDE